MVGRSSLFGRSVGWSVDWLVGRLVDWLVDQLVGWLVGRSVDWLVSRLLDWLVDRWLFSRLIGWSVGRSVYWLVGRLVDLGRLVGRLVGRSVDWLVGRSVDWLVDRWLFGRLIGHFNGWLAAGLPCTLNDGSPTRPHAARDHICTLCMYHQNCTTVRSVRYTIYCYFFTCGP